MAGWEADGWGAMVATLALGQILQYRVGHMAKFQELVQHAAQRSAMDLGGLAAGAAV